MKYITMINKLISLSILLSSCSIGPDFKTPETTLPETYSRARLSSEIQPLLSKVETEIDETTWWTYFNDEDLNQLVIKTSTNNLSIATALQRIEEASARTRGTYFGLIPQFEINSQYVKNKTAAARFPGIARDGIQFEIYSLNAQTTWEVDLYGKIRRQIEGSQAMRDKTVYTLADLLRVLQAQIGTSYIELKGLQKKKDVIDSTIKNQIEIFNLTQSRFDQGQASPIDLERAKAQLETSKARSFEVKALIDALTARISTLTQEPLNVVEEKLCKKLELPKYSGPVSISSPSELILKRPDIRIAEEEAHLATTDIGVSWANFLPQVSFTGTLARDARDPADWNSNAASAYNYGPQISWSILNLGTIINQLDASKAGAKASVLNYQAVVVQALEEVEVSLSNLSAEQQRAMHLEKALTANKEAYRIAQLQYNEGILAYADLLLIEQERWQAEFDLIDSETKVSANFIALFKALGGAWKEEV